MSKRNKRSTDSFNARILLALEKGAKQEVRITFGTPAAAIRFRHEANALRAAMRDQNRTEWERYYGVGLYIAPSDPCVVIIKSKVSEFKDALDAAGIPDFTAPPLDTNTETSPDDPKDLEKDFLASIRNLK